LREEFINTVKVALTMRVIQTFTKQNMIASNRTHFGTMKSGVANKALTSTKEQVGVII
jgi:hypothetical protein